jgi:hypothetical protein
MKLAAIIPKAGQTYCRMISCAESMVSSFFYDGRYKTESNDEATVPIEL